MRLLTPILLATLLLSALAVAQDSPFTNDSKASYGRIKGILLRTAEKVPEEDYSFKPTESVRTFGQIIGHMADSQFYFCSVALGEKNPAPNAEKTKTSKADLIAALNGAFTYCDKAYASMTDASGRGLVKLFGPEANTPKLGVLNFNNMHLAEHYGNLVTYMRIKNIVPPTSEPRPNPEAKKPEEKK